MNIYRACYDCPSNKTDCERPECIMANGKRRLLYVVNKELPGPAIQVNIYAFQIIFTLFLRGNNMETSEEEWVNSKNY